jgi:hypothetical protein
VRAFSLEQRFLNFIRCVPFQVFHNIHAPPPLSRKVETNLTLNLAMGIYIYNLLYVIQYIKFKGLKWNICFVSGLLGWMWLPLWTKVIIPGLEFWNDGAEVIFQDRHGSCHCWEYSLAQIGCEKEMFKTFMLRWGNGLQIMHKFVGS